MRSKSFAWIFLLFGITSCQKDRPFREALLNNDGQGKYWDLVYSTDIFGRINPSYTDGRYGPALVYSCDYFANNGKVIHYENLDSIRVIDRGANIDVKFNPDKYLLNDSTLFFLGQSKKILALTEKVMVLEYEYEDKKAIQIYLPSRYQNKQIMKFK